MKTRILAASTTATVLLCGALGAAERPTAAERLKNAANETGNVLQRAGNVIEQGTREAWSKTKAYLSEDPDTYQKGAAQKLEELRAELTQLRQNAAANLKDRPYFETRLRALEQHQQYIQQQLTALPADELRKGRQGKRSGVDTALERLEEHLDIAQKEVRDANPALR